MGKKRRGASVWRSSFPALHLPTLEAGSSSRKREEGKSSVTETRNQYGFMTLCLWRRTQELDLCEMKRTNPARGCESRTIEPSLLENELSTAIWQRVAESGQEQMNEIRNERGKVARDKPEETEQSWACEL